MRNVLKLGLMAVMLGGFAGPGWGASEGTVRVAVEFGADTGCWKTETSPAIFYNVEVTKPGTFVFVRLEKPSVTQADAAKVTLAEIEGAAVALDEYSQQDHDVVMAKLTKVGLYSLNVADRMPVTVCHSLENSFIDPAVRLPNPETLPTYVPAATVVAEETELPLPVPLAFGRNGCTEAYMGRANVFSFTVARDGRYLFVESEGSLGEPSDNDPNEWVGRVPTLLMDDPNQAVNIVKMEPYNERYWVVKLGRAAGYKVIFAEDRFFGRNGKVTLCLSRKPVPPEL